MSATPKAPPNVAPTRLVDASPEPTEIGGSPTPSPPPRRSRRRFGLLALLLLVVALLAWGANWAHHRFKYVHEIDARVVADVVTIGSRVEGWITHLRVESGDTVRAGDILAAVDARQADLRLKEYRADLAAVEAERERVLARRTLLDGQTKSRATSEEAKIKAARASVDALVHELKFAESEYQRAQKLSKTGVMSATTLERTRTQFLRARQDLARARAEWVTARANLEHALGARQELDVLEQEANMLVQKSAQIGARVERQALLIDEHTMRSPLDGVVSKTFVLPGEYVRLGQRMALIHDPMKIWVEANIRETEVRRLRVGQPVDILVDAYPNHVFTGTVARIGHATTGEFALLPAPNPSGNFTKVTQRVPVRIAVSRSPDAGPANSGRDEGEPASLRPGMLVEIDIRVDE
ncbi:MAG: HlyD family secretion protein [Pseudomonadota bacterium]